MHNIRKLTKYCIIHYAMHKENAPFKKQDFLKLDFTKKKKSEEGTNNNKNHFLKRIKHFSF